MKKVFALLLVLSMVFALCACGTSTTPAVTTADVSKTEPEAAPATEAAPAEKAPEDYTGKLVVYSPHDADPLNAGVAQFEAKYPNIDVEVIAAGTGELCQRIVAEAANPQGDVLWGRRSRHPGRLQRLLPALCLRQRRVHRRCLQGC